ncbi:VRR-NUC domain-containing protein [Gibbsiella quercinecans]|uniref:VRR-NUC domain-containing protein n=1 Tax=Gibbsiella quercinecans TaxID=929813 RepID=UPI00242D716B|nr:VRR-NUC domain-containing protein [Gibbsiella quercinecans]
MITDKGDYLEYYGGPVKGCPLEKVEQVNGVAWARHHYPEYLLWHTVNEGKKSNSSANLDAQMGLLKGVSDFVILIGLGVCRYPFAAIEMKREGKSQASPVSKEQREYLAHVRRLGGFAAVTYGFEQFKLAWMDMLNSTNC